MGKLGPSVEGMMVNYWELDRWEKNTIPELKKDLVLRALAITKKENFTERDIILEVGCNGGQICADLRKAGYNAIGLDIVLGERCSEGKFIRGSIERLPLKSESVRLVVDSFTFLYTDIERSMAELRRVLSPRGIALFMMHHPDKSYDALIQALEKSKLAVSDFEAIWDNEEDSAVLGCPTLRLLVNLFDNNRMITEFFKEKGFQVHLNNTEWLRDGENWQGIAYSVIIRKA